MRRLFWKFFSVVWLAMAGSIALLFAISTLFQSPFEEEVANREQTLALETTAQVLQSQGLDAATNLMAAMQRTGRNIPISVTPIGLAIDCVSIAADDLVRNAVSNGDCYRVQIAASAQSAISRVWPRTVPWLAALLAAARGLARDLACDEVLLDTWEANHEAHAFFAATGFAPRRMLWRAVP